MFNNEKEKSNNKIETLIGEKCNFIGSIQGDGTLKVDGSINGDIFLSDDLIIGLPSFCKSNITCKNAFINGKINGNILCENTLTIESCGKVKGDITVKNLIIKEGGILDGKCTMIVQVPSEEALNA